MSDFVRVITSQGRGRPLPPAVSRQPAPLFELGRVIGILAQSGPPYVREKLLLRIERGDQFRFARGLGSIQKIHESILIVTPSGDASRAAAARSSSLLGLTLIIVRNRRAAYAGSAMKDLM